VLNRLVLVVCFLP